MAATDEPITRSRIDAFDQTADVLSATADHLRAGGQRLQQAVDGYVDQIDRPNGTEWQGQTATRSFEIALEDRLSVLPAIDHAHAMADVAGQGSSNLRGTRAQALEAINQAEADDFTVDEDLSVTDDYLWESPAEQDARQQAAVAHRNYIAHCAGLLQAENAHIGAQLNAGAAQMTGMVPAHWRQPHTASGAPVGIQMLGIGRDQPPLAPPGPSPIPLDANPATMTEAEARAAYESLKSDQARYNDRCLQRPFVLPQEQGAFDACVADMGELNARKAALEARLRALGVELEPAPSPGHGPPETTGDTPPFPPPTQITGFTEHGEEQVNGRDGHGVNDSALQDAVTNPIAPPNFVPDRYGGTYRYVGKYATVALNEDGQVVTAWANSRDGWRNP